MLIAFPPLPRAKRLMDRLRSTLLLAVLLSGAISLAIAADKKPADHIHGVANCKDCHPQGIDFPKILHDSGKNCLQCHNRDTLLKSFSRAKSPRPSPAESELSEFAPDRPIKADAGMRFAQYPKQSRLGADPNRMVLIPAGPFLMGTNDRLPDEGPQHTVDLPAFFIDIYEVTNLQYKKFIDETGRRSPAHFRNRSFPPGKADHPVTYVNWNDATAYCHWAGKRLPTDEEWEKAARGTDGRIFPWGDEFDVTKANTPVRWQAIGHQGDTTPVGSFADGISPYGLYDMTGNVWEWTSSWYQAYPGNHTPSESYGKRYKTLKGGSWFD